MQDAYDKHLEKMYLIVKKNNQAALLYIHSQQNYGKIKQFYEKMYACKGYVQNKGAI